MWTLMDPVGQLPVACAISAISAFKAFSRSTGRSCSVCGKMATGTHYLVMSCNGCRSFFRRTIALSRHYKCKRAGNDRMECFKRYDCKSCRMKLCVAAGMDSERVIINDESEEKAGNDVAQARTLCQQPFQIELKPDKMMDNLLAIENAHDSVRVSSCGHTFIAGPYTDDQSGQSTSSHPQYDPVAIQILPTELVIKYKLDVDFGDFDYARNRLWIFQDIIYSMEFMKALPIYYLLDDCSKRALISSLVACCNLSTAYYAFRHDSAQSNFAERCTANLTAEIQSPFSTLFNSGMIAIIREVQLDPREFIMLKMILVCNPTLEVMSSHDATLIQHEKERCTKALLSYVMERKGIKEGPSIFAKILSIVDVVIRLTTMEKGHHILMVARGRHLTNRIPLLPNQCFTRTQAVADVAM